MTCAIMSDIRIMNKLIIYANIKFWDALCLFLAFCLSTRRVGVLGRLEQSLYVQAWCLDNMNSPRYFWFLPVMGGRHQVVTDLVVLPILPVRLWSRSFMLEICPRDNYISLYSWLIKCSLNINGWQHVLINAYVKYLWNSLLVWIF